MEPTRIRQAAEMRRRHAAGEQLTELAREYDIQYGVALQAKRFKSYAPVLSVELGDPLYIALHDHAASFGKTPEEFVLALINCELGR